jgi:DNA-binding Lrp family transcriptional regulator
MNLAQHSPYLAPEQEYQLLKMIEQGLPLTLRPYLTLAKNLACDEQQVINTLELWQQQGLIKRLGLVVLHRKLGYTANAMVVWDIEDDEIAYIANKLADEDAVTLCYQRPRVLPQWPYNLFCMIHGKSREQVLKQLEQICQRHNLSTINKDILFSTKAYKQRGGRYLASRTNQQHGAAHV